MLNTTKLVCLNAAFSLVLLTWLAFPAHAETNQIPDCSNRFSFPSDYTTQFKNAVFALDGSTVSSTWKIIVGVDSLNPNKIFVTGGPYVQQLNIKISNTAAAPWEPKLDFTSANGNIYRMYYDPFQGSGTWGSVTKYTPADNYTRSLTFYCGFINSRVDVATTQQTFSVSSRSPVEQQVNLGFLDPVAPTSGGGQGSTTPLTKSELEQTLVVFMAVFITLFIGIKFVSLLRFRV